VPSGGGVLQRAIARLRGDEPARTANGLEPEPPPEGEPTAEPRSDRPVVQLQDAPAPLAVSRTPAVSGASAQAIARAVGTDVAYASDGTPGIVFPPPPGANAASPYAPFSTAPRTVSREITMPEMAVSAAPPPSSASSSNGGAPAAEPAAAPALDPDQLYEDFLTRLRRDVLHEREQAGILIDDLP
jgi:hypothetical protein